MNFTDKQSVSALESTILFCISSVGLVVSLTAEEVGNQPINIFEGEYMHLCVRWYLFYEYFREVGGEPSELLLLHILLATIE